MADLHPSLVANLNDQPIAKGGRYVLYWMQQAQRALDNHALEYAIAQANALDVPMVAVFGITDGYPEANLRHYAFMIEGLAHAQTALKQRGVRLIIRHMAKGKSPPDAALDLASEAALIVVDDGYVRIQRQWRDHLADDAPCRVVEVTTHLVVPVETVSQKEEYAARTIRPKLHRLLDDYLVPVPTVTLKHRSIDMEDLPDDDLGLSDIDAAIAALNVDRSVPRVGGFTGGTSKAVARLDRFLSEDMNRYVEMRNQPVEDCVSHISPYLHFGQISPLTIALAVRSKRGVSTEAKDAYIEELIVRRELSHNFVWFNREYDSYDCVPDWAKKTLKKHASDKRDYIYSREQFECGDTHDPYWNAAQKEMVITGFMHNYMRMYWGKKIIEWTASPEEAFEIMLWLNNKYELDGRDPNSFTGVAWCFGKHDRPWQERAIFGQVRYMNDRGLERKCDIHAYVDKVAALEE